MQERDMSGPATQSSQVLDLTELGRRLKEARMNLSLGADEIAQRLHLPLATVADLEAGRSQRIGTAVYLKGFLRSYLRILNLPEEWANQAMAASAPIDTPHVLPAAGAVARRVPWIERYKWAASYVVGTALALTAVHWLVSNTPQLGFPDAPRVADSTPERPQVVPSVTASTATKSAVTSAPLGPVLPDTAPASADESPVMASLNPFRVPGDARAAAPSVLTLSFDEDSWVDVRDREGSKLAYQVVRAGDQRSFSEGAPFSVNIGNVRGVRADVAGTSVDLSGFTRGNVARFAVARGELGWKPVTNDKEIPSRDGG